MCRTKKGCKRDANVAGRHTYLASPRDDTDDVSHEERMQA